MNSTTRKIIEDRLIIKSTQRLRRHIQPREIAQFFSGNGHYVSKIEQDFLQALDKLINEFLEKKK